MMPMQSRRNIFKDLTLPVAQKAVNAGMWLDKFLPEQLKKGESPGKDSAGREKPTPQQQLVREVAGIGVADTYRHFFTRWKAQLTSMRVQIDGCEYLVETQLATTQGRIAIGLGDESVIETAVTLHHTYGVPYIPGSALKGLASAYAHQRLEDARWRKNGELHTLMFGTTKAAGYVTFFDALYDPNSTVKPLWHDVITVHHKEYYENQKEKAPADWDSPTPIAFLTASGSYLVALGGPPAWVKAAFNLLKHALAEYGVGAKTSSGYGRMVFSNQMNRFSDSLPGQTKSAAIPKETTPEHPTAEINQPSLAQQPATKPPKRGQDLWGKVIDRRQGRWIVQLDQSRIEVVANDKQARRRVDFGTRVRVRIDKTDPLEGSIKDVTG